MLKSLITAIFIASTGVLNAASSDTLKAVQQKPLWLRSQFAGNLGIAAIGLGREPGSSRFGADVNLGYLPKHVNGVRVFTFALKPAYSFRHFNVLGARITPYTGVSINYSFGRKIYGKIPDYYSLDYYWPNAFHFNPFTGIRLGRETEPRLYLFAELGTVDYKIWYFFKNSEVNLPEILNLAVGFIIRLR